MTVQALSGLRPAATGFWFTPGDFSGFGDAKTGGGFEPSGASLNDTLPTHGPDAVALEKASSVEPEAAGTPARQADDGTCGRRLAKHVDPSRAEAR